MTDVCSESSIDAAKVLNVVKVMPKDETLERMSSIFMAISDTTRLKILTALFENDLCVCEITNIVNLSQSAISHQLRLLRNLRLVKNRREGKKVYYFLDDDHVKELVNMCLKHVEE